MATRDYEYELDITAETRDLDRAEQAVRDLEEALDGTDDTARSALQVLGAMADDLEAELKGTASAADALKLALGDAFNGDSGRLETLVGDLRNMGLEFDEIEQNARDFADIIQRTDQIKLDALDAGLTNVGGNLNRVHDSGDQSRSVLANLAGNAAQDLGELGGVVGTLGVGIGQLAEYAVDGNIALSNLAKVAGPMAVLTGGLALVNRLTSERAREQAIDAERTRDWAAALDEAGAGIDAIVERLENVDDLTARLSGGDVLGFEDWLFSRDPVDVIEALNGIEVTAQDLAGTFESLRETTGAMSREEFIASEPIQELASALLDANLAGVDAQAVIALLHEEYSAYISEVDKAARQTKFAASSLENIQTVMQGVNQESTRASEAWEVLVTDMADGSIEAEGSVRAWNYLREELGLTNDEIAERLNQKLADKLSDEATATEEATEATREHVEAVLERVEAFRETQAAIDEVAASLGSIADRGDTFGSVIAGIAEVGELTQSLEIVGFADGIGTLVDAIDELSSSDLEGLDLVPDNWDEVLNMPEELRPVLDALSGFAADVQTEMSQAFDSGGEAGVLDWAANTRQAIIDSLPSDVTDEQVEQILSALGLLPEQVEIAIELSNQERARSVLDEISSAVESLPTDVQLQIAAVADTDPVAALQLAIDSLAAQGHEIPVELVALLDELNGDIAAVEPEPVTVGVEGDTLPITKSIEDLSNGDYKAIVKTEAETEDAERDLDDTAKERTAPVAINILQLLVAKLLLDGAAAKRTAVITAEAHTFAAENALDAAALPRRTPVDMYVRQSVTERTLISLLTGGKGYLRIPVDTYPRNIARLSGARPI